MRNKFHIKILRLFCEKKIDVLSGWHASTLNFIFIIYFCTDSANVFSYLVFTRRFVLFAKYENRLNNSHEEHIWIDSQVYRWINRWKVNYGTKNRLLLKILKYWFWYFWELKLNYIKFIEMVLLSWNNICRVSNLIFTLFSLLNPEKPGVLKDLYSIKVINPIHILMCYTWYNPVFSWRID